MQICTHAFLRKKDMDQTRFFTNRQTEGWRDKLIPIFPLNLVCRGYIRSLTNDELKSNFVSSFGSLEDLDIPLGGNQQEFQRNIDRFRSHQASATAWTAIWTWDKLWLLQAMYERLNLEHVYEKTMQLWKQSSGKKFQEWTEFYYSFKGHLFIRVRYIIFVFSLDVSITCIITASIAFWLICL